MKSPELYGSHPQGNGSLYGNRKSLSQQLEFLHNTTQVLDFSDIIKEYIKGQVTYGDYTCYFMCVLPPVKKTKTAMLK